MKIRTPGRTFYLLCGLLVLVLLVAALQYRPAMSRNASASSFTKTVTHIHTPTPSMVNTYKPAPTLTRTPTQISPSATSLPTQTQPDTTPAPELPATFYITDITGHRQYFGIGCEASAAVDWAHYFGVTINEKEFQSELPISDNPDYGFVGDVNGSWGHLPPDDYGVHAAPVAELLRDYGLEAEAEKGMTLDQVKASIAQGKPVIAWVVGNVTYGTSVEFTDSEGRISIVAAYEHVVIVTGYGTQSIRYLNNGETYEVSNTLFLDSWGTLGNMAVIAKDQ